MEANLILPNSSDSQKPKQLSRREMLAALALAPFAPLPTPATPAGDPLADEATFLAVIYIPCLEQLLASAKTKLATLGGM